MKRRGCTSQRGAALLIVLATVGLDFDTDRGLTISQVVPGSAAERDGLKTGDRLISANGTSFGEDPLQVLDPYLATGARIEFAVERDGKPLKVAVRPNPRM